MKKLILLSAIAMGAFAAHAQLLTPADGGSVKASVSERIGITDVTINYGRPGVKGREGKIWGGVVFNGYKNFGNDYGAGKDAPWRAGANENTTIEFSTDVMIDGHTLPAGKYGFFVAYGPYSSTLIFSSNTSSWGSYFYNPKEDVLKVAVRQTGRNESKERLTYEFSNETDSSATISLMWERLAIPFTVSTNLQQLQLASFDRELRGEKGFYPYSLLQVADYMQQHNVRLNDALVYADRACEAMPTFGAMMTKSQVLEKMHRRDQADSLMKVAMERGSAQELHEYARTLLSEKKKEKAIEVFEYNYKRHPNTFTTNLGMSRSCAVSGKTKEAIKYANLALAQAPDQENKQAVEGMIHALMEGREI